MRASDLPPTVDAKRDDVADRLGDAPGVVLCLDFDGTLAPIVPDADEARIDPECRGAVATLASAPAVEVAVISGRQIDDLRGRVGLEDVVYAGNHGFELRRSGRTAVHPDAADARSRIDEVCAAIEARTEQIPGCEVENKGVTATVHYRRVPDAAVDDVRDHAEEAVDDADADLEMLDGKQIIEIRPAVDWDKGRVVELLAGEAPVGWEGTYVGDDTTDEDAFEALEPEGLGVLVGADPDTAASLRVADRSDVADFLDLVADARDVD